MAQVIQRHEDAGRVEAGVTHDDDMALVGDARRAEDLDEILDGREFGDEILGVHGDVVVLEGMRALDVLIDTTHSRHLHMQDDDAGVVPMLDEPIAAHKDVRIRLGAGARRDHRREHVPFPVSELHSAGARQQWHEPGLG